MNKTIRIIITAIFILLLVTICFVACDKDSKTNYGISDDDAKKLSLDGITVVGNGTGSVSKLIPDKSGKENNMKKRETSGDGQILYDITVNYIATSDGFDYITLDKTSAKEGDTVTFTRNTNAISENEKFEIEIVFIDGSYYGGEGGTNIITSNSFIMPGRDILIYVQPKRLCRITKATNIQHGDIQISKDWLNSDDEFTVTLIPENGYHYKNDSLVIHYTDGYEEHLYPNNNIATRAKEWVRNPAYITCEFEIPQAPTYGVSIDYAIENGTISVTKNSFEENEKVVVTVTPNSGYLLDELWYDSWTQITKVNNEYAFNMPSHNIMLHATFVENIFTITVNAPNGTVVLKHDDTVLENNKSRGKDGVRVYTTPNSGFRLESVSLSDNTILLTRSSDNEYDFTMPEADVTLTVSFVDETSAFGLYGPAFANLYDEYDTSDGEITLGDFKLKNVYYDNALRNDDDLLTLVYEVKCYNGDQDDLGEFVNTRLISIALEINCSITGTFRAYGISSINLFGVTAVHPLYGDDYLKGYVRITLFDNDDAFHASGYVGPTAVPYISDARPILLYEI